MELEFESSDMKTTYDKCKYVVKVWENKFKKDFGRLPSKLDIREASKDVRSAYKTYFHLKTKILEKSFNELEGFDFEDQTEDKKAKISSEALTPTPAPVDSIVLKSVSINNELQLKDVPRSSDEHISADKDIYEKENVTATTTGKQSKSYLTKGKVSKFMKRNPRKSLLKPYKTDESCISSSQSFISTSQSFIEELNSDCSEDIQLRLTSSPVPEKVNFSSFDFVSTKRSRTINLATDLASNQLKPAIREVDNGWLDRVCENTFGSVPDNNKLPSAPVASNDTRYNDNSESNTSLIDEMNDTFNDDVISGSDDESKSPPLKKFKPAFGEYESTIILKPDEMLIKPAPVPIVEEPVRKNSGNKISEEKYKEYDFKIDETDEESPESSSTSSSRLKKKAKVPIEPKIKTRAQARVTEPTKSSRSLNENYIKINLKKKIYSRGKKHVNFSKYKARQYAKLKKQINEESDSLLPVEACEESPLCTIEEASEKRRTLRSGTRIKQSSKSISKKSKKVVSDNEDQCEQDEIIKEPIHPFYENGSKRIDTDVLHEALQKFGYMSFRTGQESAIRRILEGKSTLLTLSTGSGKSLCYMLPAYLYSRRDNCLTLVISPLVSLMDDQVANVPPFIKAACFHSNQTKVQREKVKELISSGKLSILFVSPELILSEEHNSGFKSIFSILPPIAFACVDEAHCVSQWSHNFRPSYLLLPKILRESLNVNTILGLTATATKATIESIKKHFGVADDGVISDIPVPDNLSLYVLKVTNKEEALLSLFSSEKFSSYESIIIYCTRRDECERVAKFLRVNLQTGPSTGNNRKRISEQAECYHAGLSSYKRRSIQNAFMAGNIRIVVATVAFGMGINKSNIRSVIHYNLPRNIESYVQEIGRAGRDQLHSSCYVFLDQQGRDKYELRRHIYEDSVDRSTIKKLLKKIFIPCSCDSICKIHEVCFSISETVQDLDLPETNISTILCYLELDESTNVNLLSPGYVDCKITYPSVAELEKASQHYEPLARLMKMYRKNVSENVFEFPAVAAASSLNLMSNMFKNKLKNLEWVTVNGKSKRSPINVQFSNLGFRLSAPGNLTESELDEILDSIFKKANEKEKTSMLQLEAIHSLLLEAVKKEPESQSDFLKERIRQYFELEDPFEMISLKNVDENVDEESLIRDVKSLVCSHRDVMFNGRSVARIFHGIQSPNFPALSWWRSGFWRSHIETDFHTISKIASAEILKL